MKFIADFHIHSKYSLATSRDLDVENLIFWSKLKGINVLGTGDCIHPKWFIELKEKLIIYDNGLLKLKSFLDKEEKYKNNYFIFSTEISSIYKKNNRVYKIHNLCILPDFDSVQKFQNSLKKIGNIGSNGRPILKLDSRDLLDILLNINERSILIPAHIWTPHFSLFGEKSGFNSIQDCFGDLSNFIFSLETGLSSDPIMNNFCSFLDNFCLVSNSDAHSPKKIGREANIFDCDLSYDGIYNSLKTKKGFLGTIEFFPEEGKYYFDGHKNCDICFSPSKSIFYNKICPKCNRKLTIGVLYRIFELADRFELDLKKIQKFYSIIQLKSILSNVYLKNEKSNFINKKYFEILEKFNNEFNFLLFEDLENIKKFDFNVFELIYNMRNQIIEFSGGFDGRFGKVKNFHSKENYINKKKQDLSLELKKFKEIQNQKYKKEFLF